MCEVALHTLTVIQAPVAHRTTGSADSQSAAIELVATSITKLGRFIHQLIERGENVISELYLTNGYLSHTCIPNSEADDSLFCQRSIEHSLLPKFLL